MISVDKSPKTAQPSQKTIILTLAGAPQTRN